MDCSLEEHKEEDMRIELKGLLQSNALFQYILDTSVYPVEPASMKELRKITAKHPLSRMSTSPDQGQFLMMILKLINAKKTMEIGVFTGYSLLSTALTLPDDGKVVGYSLLASALVLPDDGKLCILAMDTNREDYELGLPVIKKAGVAHKIDFREGPALPLLDHLLADEKNHGTYDFIYVDADKNNYWNYHTKLVDLIKVGGVICYDNTLLAGSVAAPPDVPLNDEYLAYHRGFVVEFNKSIVADPRVEGCLLPVGDGVTLCRRIT